MSERRAINTGFTQRVVVLQGSFDPLHPGHIELMSAAKRHGDLVVVGVHSDAFIREKRSSPSFQPLYDRIRLVESIKYPDVVLASDDELDLCMTAARIFNVENKNITYCTSRTTRLLRIAEPLTAAGFQVKGAVGGVPSWDRSRTLLEDYKNDVD